MMAFVLFPEKTPLSRAKPPMKTFVNEDAKRVKLAAGKLRISIYNMRPGLAEEGSHFVETLDDLDEFNGIDCRNHD